MMNYTLIDAHSHLWLKQDTVVDGLPIRTLENGRSLFSSWAKCGRCCRRSWWTG